MSKKKKTTTAQQRPETAIRDELKSAISKHVWAAVLFTVAGYRAVEHLQDAGVMERVVHEPWPPVLSWAWTLVFLLVGAFHLRQGMRDKRGVLEACGELDPPEHKSCVCR